MRKIRLTDDDFAMFGNDFSPHDYEYFLRHKDTFRRMWIDQGKKFWKQFVICFRSFTMEFGPVKEYPGKPEHYEQLIDEFFAFITKQFIEGKPNMAKNLIMDIVLVAQYRHMIQYLESKSFAKDPFYYKDTRETFRNLFGPATERSSYVKVYIYLPLYLKFGGASIACLRTWIDAEECDDDSFCGGLNNEPKTLHPEWTSYLSRYFDLAKDGAIRYKEELRNGSPSGPCFLEGWSQGNPRMFFDSKNPLFIKNWDKKKDWRDGLTKDQYMQFIIFAKKYVDPKDNYDIEHPNTTEAKYVEPYWLSHKQQQTTSGKSSAVDKTRTGQAKVLIDHDPDLQAQLDEITYNSKFSEFITTECCDDSKCSHVPDGQQQYTQKKHKRGSKNKHKKDLEDLEVTVRSFLPAGILPDDYKIVHIAIDETGSDRILSFVAENGEENLTYSIRFPRPKPGDPENAIPPAEVTVHKDNSTLMRKQGKDTCGATSKNLNYKTTVQGCSAADCKEKSTASPRNSKVSNEKDIKSEPLAQSKKAKKSKRNLVELPDVSMRDIIKRFNELKTEEPKKLEATGVTDDSMEDTMLMKFLRSPSMIELSGSTESKTKLWQREVRDQTFKRNIVKDKNGRRCWTILHLQYEVHMATLDTMAKSIYYQSGQQDFSGEIENGCKHHCACRKHLEEFRQGKLAFPVDEMPDCMVPPSLILLEWELDIEFLKSLAKEKCTNARHIFAIHDLLEMDNDVPQGVLISRLDLDEIIETAQDVIKHLPRCKKIIKRIKPAFQKGGNFYFDDIHGLVKCGGILKHCRDSMTKIEKRIVIMVSEIEALIPKTDRNKSASVEFFLDAAYHLKSVSADEGKKLDEKKKEFRKQQTKESSPAEGASSKTETIDKLSTDSPKAGVLNKENGKRKLKTCANCGKEELALRVYKKCQKCKEENWDESRFYCSRNCQVEDWQAKHRKEHKQKQEKSK
ncbi:uncharacterized protein LOC141901745 [Tubulanus polymorphus]|uniref:uncharacterized protein LOC141901745 n=1 Tax=Tubulanus polymorphus TaxID=672921 RepID=UPI003DA4B0C5